MKFRNPGLCVLTASLLLYSCKKDSSSSTPQEPDLMISSFSEHAGGDDIITITGNGFSGTGSENKVTINGKSAEVMGSTATNIQVKVPMKAGSGLIEVVFGSRKASSGKAFVYDSVWYVSTVAGIGATNVFDDPIGIAVAKDGAIYVSDYDHHDVKKIIENADGTATVSSFALGLQPHFPNALWIGENENLLVTDIGNRTLQYSKTGVLQTLHYGYSEGVATDEAGNIYNSLYQDFTVRKLSTDGSSATIGGVSGNSTILSYPKGITVNKSGSRIVVADWWSHRIKELNRKFDGTYEITTLAGSADGSASGSTDGKGNEARFYYPTGVAMDEKGAVYVADAQNNKIRKIVKSSNGEVTVTTIAGTGSEGATNGKAHKASFKYPVSLWVNPGGTVIYITDRFNNQIRKLILQ